MSSLPYASSSAVSCCLYTGHLLVSSTRSAFNDGVGKSSEVADVEAPCKIVANTLAVLIVLAEFLAQLEDVRNAQLYNVRCRVQGYLHGNGIAEQLPDAAVLAEVNARPVERRVDEGLPPSTAVQVLAEPLSPTRPMPVRST